MTDQSQWEALQQSWQTPPDHPLPELANLLRRRTWIIWAMTVLDVIGTVAILGFAAWMLAHEPTAKEFELSVLVLVLFPLAWAVVLYVRRGTWRLESAAPADMLKLSIRRCRASINLARLTQMMVPLSFAIALLSRYLFDSGSLGLALDSGTRNLIRAGTALMFIAALVGGEWYKRRKRAELERLEALQLELGEEVGSPSER